MDLYLKEIEERGAYVRHNTQLFATWFSWHVASNFAAMAWVANAITDKENLKTKVISILPILFIVLSPLALAGCTMMRKNLSKESVRIQSAWLSYVRSANATVKVESLMPIEFYKRCVLIMALGCGLLALMWGTIMVYILQFMPT